MKTKMIEVSWLCLDCLDPHCDYNRAIWKFLHVLVALGRLTSYLTLLFQVSKMDLLEVLTPRKSKKVSLKCPYEPLKPFKIPGLSASLFLFSHSLALFKIKQMTLANGPSYIIFVSSIFLHAQLKSWQRGGSIVYKNINIIT